MQQNNDNLSLIIDTDAGHDDALALMLLIASRASDIRAVTTVPGNSTITNVTRNAQAILDLAGTQAIPLYSGAEAPLERPLVTAVVHGESGLDGLDMSNTKYALTGDAVDQIVALVKSHPGELTILALGPLTNIALALQRSPEIADLMKQIVIMGGAIEVPGNKNRVAEFNMFVDPEAADIVFNAPIKKILVPLDVCNDIILTLDTFRPLAGKRLYDPLMSMMRHFISGIEMDEGVKGALVYDALAAYYLVNPQAFELKSMDVVVETKGEHTFGMTVAERRIGKSIDKNIMVATYIDGDKFTNDLISSLCML